MDVLYDYYIFQRAPSIVVYPAGQPTVQQQEFDECLLLLCSLAI